MKVYTVHRSPDRRVNPDDEIVFVREGFSWPALIVPTFWILWNRMWWVLLAWLAVGAALGVAGEYMPRSGWMIGVISVLLSLWFALEANALHRWSLTRKGWRMLDVTTGRDREEAERAFFLRYRRPSAVPPPLRPGPTQTANPASRVPNAGNRPAGSPAGSRQPVIGLFPHTDRT